MLNVAIPKGPSLLFNNLSASPNFLAYIHINRVFLVATEGVAGAPDAGAAKFRELPYKVHDEFICTQAKWIQIGGTVYLILTTTSGFQVWNAAGSNLLFFSPTSSMYDAVRNDTGGAEETSPDGDGNADPEQSAAAVDRAREHGAEFLRGVAAIGESNCFAVGASTGDIFIYELRGDGSEIAFRQALTRAKGAHASAITAIASSTSHIVSAGDNGSIAVWSVQGWNLLCTFDGVSSRSASESRGFPCTGVATRADIVFGAFATGHLRLFSVAHRCCVVEIAAHARCITALDLHPAQDLLVSVGEDSLVNVWNVGPGSGGTTEPELSSSRSVKDHLLTGVQFLESGQIITSSYDRETLSVLQSGSQASHK